MPAIKKQLLTLAVKLIKYFKTQNGDFVHYGDNKYWQQNGFSIIPNHYYSPIPDIASLSSDIFTKASKLPGININTASQIALLKKLERFSKELLVFKNITQDIDNQKDPKFYFGNMAFDNLDACIYYCMIRFIKPKLIVEVGSGWSTKIAAAAVNLNKNTKLISIGPFPQPILVKGFAGLTSLVKKKVQDVPISYFSKLKKGDILFIDSSHTVKTAGDVNYLFLEVLPRLNKGVYIHIHDIFLPWEYPEEWIKSEYRFWNEQHLLQALLVGNTGLNIEIANHYLYRTKTKLVKNVFPFLKEYSSGSIWLKKVS